MFVKSMKGVYYPLDQVEKFWQDKTGKTIVEFAELRDVGTITLHYGEFEALVEMRSKVVSAQNGYFVLQHVSEDDGSISLEKAPVLAWQISAELGVVPVTIEGVNDGHGNTVAVLYPSGQVTTNLGGLYETEEHYLKAMNSDA